MFTGHAAMDADGELVIKGKSPALFSSVWLSIEMHRYDDDVNAPDMAVRHKRIIIRTRVAY